MSSLMQVNDWLCSVLEAMSNDLFRYKGILAIHGEPEQYIFQVVARSPLTGKICLRIIVYPLTQILSELVMLAHFVLLKRLVWQGCKYAYNDRRLFLCVLRSKRSLKCILHNYLCSAKPHRAWHIDMMQGVHEQVMAVQSRKWGPGEKRRSQMVFIGRDIGDGLLEEGFKSCIQKQPAETQV